MSTNNTNEKASWLTGLLSGWGIKESWAKIIAGAIIGALGAAGLLTGCSSDQGSLSVSRGVDGTVVISYVPPVSQQK